MLSWLFRPDIDALVKKEDFDGLVALLGHREAELRARASTALVGLPGAGPALIAALKQGIAGVAPVLAQRGEGVAALVEALGHDSFAAPQEARAALVRLRATDALRHVVETGRSAQARALALRALGELGGPELSTALSRALRDPAEEVRDVAVSLGARPHGRPAGAGRGDADIDALSRSPRPADASQLREALDRGGEQARVYAISGLARLGQADAVLAALRDPSPSVRAEAARALGSLRVGAPELAALLSDRDDSVRGAAALALGQSGDRRWVTPLITALEAGDGYAARALGQLGDRVAVPALIRALDRVETADLAAEALGVLGDPAAIPALEALLERWKRDRSLRPDDPDAGDMAREALGKLGRPVRPR